MKTIPLIGFFSPWAVFIFSWVVQIALYLMNIAEFMPTGADAWSAIYNLVLISAGAFLPASLIGYLLARSWLALGSFKEQIDTLRGKSKILRLSKSRTRLAALTLMFLIVVITLSNWRSYGPLPAITLLTRGDSQYTYLNYGRLMYITFSAAMLLALLSLFERSRLWIAFMISLATGTFLVYVSRGFLIQAILQYVLLWIFIRRPKLSLRTILLTFLVLIVIVLIMGWIGSIRTGTNHFINAMQIRQEWRIWPSGVLWIIGYISFPLANMVALLNSFSEHTGGVLNLTASVPPLFWGVLGLEDTADLLSSIIGTYFPNPLNTVATYNGWIFIDFGIWGMLIFNFILGLIGSFLYTFARATRSLLACIVCAIFVSCLVLGVFANLWLNATILTQFALAFLLSGFLKSRMVDMKHKVTKAREYV
ncbi:MAG: hypothetical protein C4332_00615 [Meiothermus sp.]